MKIRNGFVSNSSSSSFVIDANKYTCVDIAIDMIEQLLEHNLDYEYITKKEYNKLKKLYTNRLKKLKNKNVGIFIQDGDDIEIEKVGNKIYVEASNHVYWNLDSLYNEYKDDDYYDVERNTKWYFPQIDNKHLGTWVKQEYAEKYGKEWLYRCENPKCNNQMRYIVKDNIVFCPNCMTDPNGKVVAFRKEKLERLINKKDGI